MKNDAHFLRQAPVRPEFPVDGTANGPPVPVQPPARRLPCTEMAVLPTRQRACDRAADNVS